MTAFVSMGSRLASADKRLIGVALLALALSAAYVSSNYDAAFPQASLTLPLSRDQITARAQQFLSTRALATNRFYNITLFDPDEEARLYLERELGLAQANRLMQADAPVWRWRARWFLPPQKEELFVWLRPDGKLSGFEHRILETEAGPRLDRLSARLLAEAFLQGQTNLPHKLVSEETESRPNRDDHTFTWEQEGFRAKDATIRRVVEIQGGKVGRYREYLFVPEQWQRDFAKLRSSNELYASIAQGLYALLAAGALFFLLDGLRKHLIPWRPLIILSLVVAGFNLLNGLNSLPFAIDGMATTSTMPEMILLGVLQALGSGSGVLLYVLAPLAAGFVLFRGAWPLHLTPDRGFRRTGIGTRSFFRATAAGVTLFAGHLMFLTAFYLYGAKAGVWSPQDVQYSDMIATPMPWVYPIAIALMASTAEEFWFRFLAIPMLRKLVRINWLAVVIPAFTWGFLHANYPQQPGYIRGVEVGLIGVAAGLVMQRYGIVATLVWHYMIDAFLIGLSLFRAENWVYRAQGAIVALAIAAPVLIVAVLYRRNHGFLAEATGVPDAVAPVQTEPATDRPEQPQERVPMLWRARWLALASLSVAILAVSLHPGVVGDFLKLEVTREQAETVARAGMRARNLDPAAWRMVSDFTANLRGVEFEYLREQVGLPRANQILKERLVHAVWQVRYFQPLNSEEWRFLVNARGAVYRVDHVLDEKAAGARPTTAEAQRIAEEYLVTRHGLPLRKYALVESQEEKRDNRVDHSFVWEDSEFHVGEARLRLSLLMVGNEPCQYRPFLKLPETWTREFSKTRVTSFLPSALLGIAGVPLVVAFFRRLGARDQRFHWRAYTIAGVAALVLTIVSQAGESPTWLAGYDTSTPLSNYYGRLAATMAMNVLLTSGGVFAAALAFDTFRQAAIPFFALPHASVARAVCIAVLFGGLNSVLGWFWQLAPGQHLDWPMAGVPDLDTLLPGLDALIDAALQATLTVCLLGIAVCGALLLLRKRGLVFATSAAVLALALARVAEPIQAPFAVLVILVGLAALFLVLMTCTMDVFSAGVGLFWALTAGGVWSMLAQPMAWLRWNGMAAAVTAVLLGVAVIRRYNYATRRSDTAVL